MERASARSHIAQQLLLPLRLLLSLRSTPLRGCVSRACDFRRLGSSQLHPILIMADEIEEQAKDTQERNSAEEGGDGDAGAEENAAEQVPKEEAADEEVEDEEEEEAVDPKLELEASCKPRCVKQLLSYQACERRVEEEGDQKHCTGQYFDYWGCVDKCSAHKLFWKLK